MAAVYTKETQKARGLLGDLLGQHSEALRGCRCWAAKRHEKPSGSRN